MTDIPEITPKMREIMDTFAKKKLSTREFNKLLKEAANVAQLTINKEHPTSYMTTATVFGEKENGKREIVAIGFAELGEDRQKVFSGLGMKIAEENIINPVAIFLSTEAWVRHYAEGDDTSKKPSDFPDKQEALITAGMSFDGRANMATDQIIRLKDNTMSISDSTNYSFYEKGKKSVEPYILGNFFVGYMLGKMLQSKN